MRTLRWCLFVVAGAVLVACASVSQADTIVNPSFEDPVLEDTPTGYYVGYTKGETKYGWRQSGGATSVSYGYIARPGTNFPYTPTPPDGANMMVLRRSGTTGVQMDQEFGPIAAGEYTFGAKIVGLDTLPISEYAMLVYDVTSSTYLGGVTDNAGFASSEGITLTTTHAVIGSWTPISFDVTAPADHDLLVVIAPITNGFVAFDNLTTIAIPEPSSIMLASLAGLGLLAYAWRKRR